MGRLRALAAGAALVVAAHGVAVAQQGEDERLGVGQPFPELALQDVHGGEVILAGRPAAGATLVVYLHPTQRLSGKLVRDMIKLLPVREDGAVVLIFSRAEGDTIAKAQEAKDRFRVLVDGDRSAHEALGIVALPSCYVVSREGVITHARRGYTVSLARELGEDLDVALGLISAEELARRRAASGKRESAATKQLHRRLNLVDARLRRGDAETALRILEPLVEEYPDEAAVLSRWALALHAGGDPQALASLRRAHQVAPDDARVAVALAELLVAQGELEAAEQLARGVIQGDPRAGRAHFVLGELLAARGRWKEAAAAYKVAAQEGLE